ncbi:MAG: GWxTD domain-containing protein [Gemmatimonadota bacterium]|nr:GWxTD domain-containing protein [Gemmatimonadota bacterium]
MALCASFSACTPWQRVGTEAAPDPGRTVSHLFDAATIFAEMGLLVAGDPVPFVAAVRYLPGTTGDSTLAVVGISLTNDVLTFRRRADVFEARYRVEIAFQRDGEVLQFSRQDENVQVGSLAETQRADESVVFQQLIVLPPGPALVSITVRDRNGASFSEVADSLRVPALSKPGSLSSIVPVYRATPRTSRARGSDFVINPKAAVPYNEDTLTLYLEIVGPSPRDVLVIRGIAADQREMWRDTVEIDPDQPLRSVILPIEPRRLPIGVTQVEAAFVGARDTARTAVLASFSDQWVVSNFDDMLSLLRYFVTEQTLRSLRDVPEEERAEEWRSFWETTDPDPLTPTHEALNLYFERVQEANARFDEPGVPGWLTDRGEVFITAGPPDEIFDSSSDLEYNLRYIRWTYVAARLVLEFIDESGFGRFRLTDRSRADFTIVVNRYRRSG